MSGSGSAPGSSLTQPVGRLRLPARSSRWLPTPPASWTRGRRPSWTRCPRPARSRSRLSPPSWPASSRDPTTRSRSCSGPGQAHRPGAVVSVEDRQVPDTAGGTQTLRVYKPEGVINAAPIIMWIHGGGWGAVRHRHLRRVLPRTGQQDGLHHRQSRPLPSAPGFRHCGDEPAAGAASRCDRGAAAVTVAGMPPRSTPLRWPSRFLAGHEDAARRAGRATLRPLRHPAVLITGAVVLLAGCAGTDRGTAPLRPQAAGSASARASAPPAR